MSSGGYSIRVPVYEQREVTDADLERSFQIDRNFYMAEARGVNVIASRTVPIVHTRSDGSVYDGTLEVLITNRYGDRRMASILRMLQIMLGNERGAQFYYDAKPYIQGGYIALTDWDGTEQFIRNVSFQQTLQAINYPPEITEEIAQEYLHFVSMGGFKKAAATLDDEQAMTGFTSQVETLYESALSIRQQVHDKHPGIETDVVSKLYEILRKIKKIDNDTLDKNRRERNDTSKRLRVSAMPLLCNSAGIDTLFAACSINSSPLPVDDAASLPTAASTDVTTPDLSDD